MLGVGCWVLSISYRCWVVESVEEGFWTLPYESRVSLKESNGRGMRDTCGWVYRGVGLHVVIVVFIVIVIVIVNVIIT